MCLLCNTDGNTSRHTMPWLRDPDRPRPRTAPLPKEHGTLRGCRQHWSAGAPLCSVCEEYWESPAYTADSKAERLSNLEAVLAHKIAISAPAPQIQDLEERIHVLKNGPRPKKPKETGPRVQVNTRIPEDLDNEIKARAREEGISRNAFVVKALTEYLLL